MSDALWHPSEDRILGSNMSRFLDFLRQEKGLDFPGYGSLWDWSVTQRAAFWRAVWEFFDVACSQRWDEVLVKPDEMMESRWFVGARLNFAENLLRAGEPDREALVFTSEDGSRRRVTYAQLREHTARAAPAMRASGVEVGDRVAGFMPNVIEAVVAMLAATSIGAIWSSCSPDFGIKGVLDRFGQIEPKLLFTADGYLYNGRRFDSLERISGVLEALPSIEKVVVVPYTQAEPNLSPVRDAVHWGDFLGSGPVPELAFEQLPFDHPLYIMYSSGTTGVPKCIVHGVGGTLLQHLKELSLHTDVHPEHRVFYFTTCGWMMWNWLVSTLALGATVLLFDGNPFHPDPGAIFRLAEKERMAVFGTSARYIAAVEKAGLKPREQFDLGALRVMCSTGSPLSVESFEYVYREVKTDLQLASISGGTDIISCFALGNPMAPVHRGELQCRGLGMKVEAFDHGGQPVRGVKGELVCTASFPSQPIYFWNDPGKAKYRDAYFAVYDNVWRHGDFVEITQHDGMTIFGRSDATLNPGGVRIGTSEIYRQVMTVPEVVDSLVSGQEWDGDTRVLLFVVLRAGVTLDETLVKRIKSTIRRNTTPRHVPAKVIAVADIPRTISGKKVELAVGKVIRGEPILNRDALANPEALENFRDLEELKS